MTARRHSTSASRTGARRSPARWRSRRRATSSSSPAKATKLSDPRNDQAAVRREDHRERAVRCAACLERPMSTTPPAVAQSRLLDDATASPTRSGRCRRSTFRAAPASSAACGPTRAPIDAGDLFVALVGRDIRRARFPGDAVGKGATGVVVSRVERDAGSRRAGLRGGRHARRARRARDVPPSRAGTSRWSASSARTERRAPRS